MTRRRSKKEIGETRKVVLPVKLTSAESALYGNCLANLALELVALEETKREFAKDIGDQIKEKRKHLESKARVVRSGLEERYVEVRDEFRHETNEVDVVRMDTGEVVATRPMTEEDRQQPLPLRVELDGVEFEMESGE